jgi:hypothetical protein
MSGVKIPKSRLMEQLELVHCQSVRIVYENFLPGNETTPGIAIALVHNQGLSF